MSRPHDYILAVKNLLTAPTHTFENAPAAIPLENIIHRTIIHSTEGVVRILKTKLFAKFARRERIADSSLSEAVERAGQGLVDADLGGGLIKQRIARKGQGRSGGYRMLIAYRFGDFAVFMFGFAKNERDNIDPEELEVLQTIAGQWLADAGKIGTDVAAGTLIEVKHDDEN